MQTPESFEKFYFTKVGMGEACGCAERIIDVYEFNRLGGKQASKAVRPAKRRFNLKSLARKYGLLGRPEHPPV